MIFASVFWTLICTSLLTHAAPPPAPLSSDIAALAGVEPVQNTTLRPGDPSTIAQVQLYQFIRQVQVAALEYGIDNIPKFGYSGYPHNLVDTLKVWQAQYENDIYVDNVYLSHYNAQEVTACKYQSKILGIPIDDTDAYLTTIKDLARTGLGVLLYYSNNDVEAAAASEEARRATYIDTIAGLNPTSTPYDTVIPPEYAYWQASYYIVPGSCSAPLKYPPFHPINATSLTPPPSPGSLSPASTIASGTTFTVSQSSTIGGAAPAYAAFLNQIDPIVYAPVTKSSSGSGQVSFKVPSNVVGNVFFALVKSDSAKTVDDVAAQTVAGPALFSVGRA